jgi:hypothetical protein
MEAAAIIQQCQQPTGLYDKQQFLQFISELSQEEFNKFCREIFQLRLFYDSNRGVWVTDQKKLIDEHPADFWPLKEIDLDAPINS